MNLLGKPMCGDIITYRLWGFILHNKELPWNRYLNLLNSILENRIGDCIYGNTKETIKGYNEYIR